MGSESKATKVYFEKMNIKDLLFCSIKRFNKPAIISFSAKSYKAPGELGISIAENLDAGKTKILNYNVFYKTSTYYFGANNSWVSHDVIYLNRGQV